MYKIGEFSNLSKITVRMLRHYDEMKILPPVYIDELTGYRYYSSDQLVDAKSIIEYRDMGFNISEISMLLSADEVAIKTMLYEKRVDIKSNIEIESDKLKLLDYKINNLGKEMKMEKKVQVKEIPSVNVISLRCVIPNHNAEGLLWENLKNMHLITM